MVSEDSIIPHVMVDSQLFLRWGKHDVRAERGSIYPKFRRFARDLQDLQEGIACFHRLAAGPATCGLDHATRYRTPGPSRLDSIAKLGPDLLRNGAKPIGGLARASGSHEDALYRVLRALASAGVFAETSPSTFELTSGGMPALRWGQFPCRTWRCGWGSSTSSFIRK
jgi:hypothetical protein